MRKRIYIGSLAAVAVAALFLFSETLVSALWYSPDTTGPVPTLASPLMVSTSSLPSRLIIPSLNINANVQYLGINAAGNMQAPDNFTDVGWYQYGTAPGYVGSAVIDGHVDNGLGLDGVFKHLDDLKVGDDVYISAKGGTMLHFVVSDVEVYPYTDVPVDTIFTQNDTARLNLITCDGTWVNGKDTYNERLVVYTTLVGSS